MTKIKICGLKRVQDIEVANELDLNFVGFVFAKSKRQVTKEQARLLKSKLRDSIQAVGIFVNHDIIEILDLLSEQIIDVVQFHGQETEDDIKRIKEEFPWVKVIKAVSVTSEFDILKWEDSIVDYLLLDHGTGGTGKSFDWKVLDKLDGFKKPFFIAGGLGLENVKEVLLYQPFGVDVSGGVETDGIKDENKMKRFVEEVRA
ncbi:MAG: phosphoribosylanthranilate isomerase [Lachnospiraceae bacterium]